jgi:plastocyanin
MASTVAAPTSVAAGHPKAKWTRVAVLGFLLMAAGLALWIVGGLIAGQSMGEDGMFFGGGILAALIGAGVVWRFGTPGKAVGALLAFLTMGAFFWVAFSLGGPAAFVEFSGAVMFVMGAFTALGYSIGAIVRRRELHTEATRGESRAMRIMLAIVALAMVVSGVLNFTSRTTVDAAAAAGATEVAMSNFEFAPATLEATAGEASVLVTNSDAFNHDFAIESLDINTGLIGPGSQKLVEIDAPAGEYFFRCTLHSDSDPATAGQDGNMSGMLTIK